MDHQSTSSNENSVLSRVLVTASSAPCHDEGGMLRGSEPHKRGSAKTCAEHMHRRLLQTAFWPLAELSQRVPNNIQSRTNAQSSVSPTSLQMQCKLHLQKPGWYKKQSPALGICLHPMQLDYKAHVLKQLSRHDYWLRQFP